MYTQSIVCVLLNRIFCSLLLYKFHLVFSVVFAFKFVFNVHFQYFVAFIVLDSLGQFSPPVVQGSPVVLDMVAGDTYRTSGHQLPGGETSKATWQTVIGVLAQQAALQSTLFHHQKIPPIHPELCTGVCHVASGLPTWT